MRRWIVLGCLLLVAFVIASFAIYNRTRNRLIVANTSGQTISELMIAVGGKTIRFVNVPPGGVVTSTFPIRSDDHFVVRGKFADDTIVSADCGYVTHGMWGERARFTIGAGGEVELSQSRFEA